MKKTIIFSMMAVLVISGNALALDMNQVKIHGFISQGWLKSDQNNYYYTDSKEGTFQFNEFGINFSTELSENLRLGIQLLSRDLGEFGNNETELDWAFADYRYRNWLGFRAGKMKMAYGFYNQSRDIDAARSCIFLPPAVYNDAYRETQKAITGIGVYGLLPAGFSYQVQFGRLDIDNKGLAGKLWSQSLKIPVETLDIESDNDTYSLNIEWNTPIEGLRIGATSSPMTIKVPSRDHVTESDIILLSAEYLFKGLSLAGEYRLAATEMSMGSTVLSDLTSEQYYLMAGYRFNNWLEIGSYYSVRYRDKDDREGENFIKQGRRAESAWLKDFAVFSRFDITDNWILKIEGHHFNGLSEIVTSEDNNPSKYGFMFAAKVTFTF